MQSVLSVVVGGVGAHYLGHFGGMSAGDGAIFALTTHLLTIDPEGYTGWQQTAVIVWDFIAVPMIGLYVLSVLTPWANLEIPFLFAVAFYFTSYVVTKLAVKLFKYSLVLAAAVGAAFAAFTFLVGLQGTDAPAGAPPARRR